MYTINYGVCFKWLNPPTFYRSDLQGVRRPQLTQCLHLWRTGQCPAQLNLTMVVGQFIPIIINRKSFVVRVWGVNVICVLACGSKRRNKSVCTRCRGACHLSLSLYDGNRPGRSLYRTHNSAISIHRATSDVIGERAPILTPASQMQ